MSEKQSELSHIRQDGTAAMVDVSQKPISTRNAVAQGRVSMAAETVAAIMSGELPKGDVLAVARIAGIQAAKKTPDLIPLCHQLPLSKVEIDFENNETEITILCRVKTVAQTGVEMEALTAVSVAALTIYDMCKAIDKAMVIREVVLVKKEKT